MGGSTWTLMGVLGFVVGMAAGCGEAESVFPGEDAGGSSGNGNTSGGIGESSSSGNNGAGGKPSTPPGVLAECASSTFGGSLLPMQLTMVLDTSSSMCLDAQGTFDCRAPETRWQNTTRALRSFLTSPSSAGLTIAIRTFGPITPYDYDTADISKHLCEPAHYEIPQYLPKELPWTEEEGAILNTEIGIDTSDGRATQTQTGAALRGASTFTAAERTRLANVKGVGMLLVTDGIPAGCDPASPFDGSEIDDQLAIDAAAAAKQAGLKLYVLNLGGDEDTLNEIAAAAGTEAITISGTNSDEVVSKLNQIRGEALSCEFALPTAQGGGTVDYGKVNLGWLKGQGQESELLTQSSDCSNGRGWQYDDPQNPTSIRLCGTICDEVLATPTGQIDVVLGCKTEQGPIN